MGRCVVPEHGGRFKVAVAQTDARLALQQVSGVKPRARWRLRAPFRPRTRKIIAAALLAVVVAIEYRFSTLPISTDITGPLAAPVGSELVLSGVATDGPILAYSGRVGEAADIRFDRARISPETIGLLRAVGVELSEAEGPISWITGTETASKIVFEVSAVAGARPPSELRLRALPGVGAKQPQLEIEPRGAPLQALIGAPFTPQDVGAKSVKTLNVGGRNIQLAGAVPLKILASEGASLRARFSPATGAQPEEFILGSIPVHASDQGGLKVRSVALRKSAESGDRYDYFACAAPAEAISWSGSTGLEHGRCAAGNAFVTASQLRVSGQDASISLTGAGWAQRGGDPVGVDPLGRIAENQVLAGVLLAINLALVAWLCFEFLGRRLGLKSANWSGGVFISYRREDSAPQAGRLYDNLCAHFGGDRVFMDVDTIRLGDDFARKIRESLDVTDALLAVIGKRWADARDDAGRRRLDDPDDFVLKEIATALERGTWVIPVLVGGTDMPREQELPQALAPLARRNAIDVSDARFTLDMKNLIAALEQGPAQPDVERADYRGEAAMQ